MDAEGQSFEFQFQNANNSLYDLSSQLRQIQKLSNRSNESLLAQRIANMSSQTSETTNLVRRVVNWPEKDLGPREIVVKSQLKEEFDSLILRMKETQGSITDRLKKKQQQQQQLTQEQQAAINESTPLMTEDGAHSQQQVLDVQDQSEINLNTSLIDERDAEIAEVQRGAREINAIFQDLGVLLSEQGQQLDSVEDNITDLARRTERAGQQLVKAENYQRSRGKWTCIALSILLGITIVIAVTVLS